MNDNSRCARCGAAFHCGVSDTKPCWCVEVSLSEATRTALAERHVGCLCAVCLAQAQADLGSEAPGPGSPPALPRVT